MNFIGIYYRDSIYDILKQKKTYVQKHCKKKINEKKVMDFWMA
jgi:hypothetical protein